MISELDKMNIVQKVYNPIRDPKRIGKNAIKLQNSDSEIIYSLILNNFTDRIMYKKKIGKIVHDIEGKIDLTKIDFIHAHTWYSDGGVAYELFKKYKIPYIVAVRNTDLNIFLKYFIFTRTYGKSIFLNSKKIVTISTVYMKRLLNDRRLADIKQFLTSNIIVLPNGLDPYWIQNLGEKRNPPVGIVKLLYIGKFNSGKNVSNLVKAVMDLNKNDIRYELRLIGGTGTDHEKVIKLIQSRTDILYTEPVFDLNLLREYYQKADIFVMPSKAETFGLVYSEALLQGLPVLYTRNEGIDGFYNCRIGEKVNDLSIKEIADKIAMIVKNFTSYDFEPAKVARNHIWGDISKDYMKLYKRD